MGDRVMVGNFSIKIMSIEDFKNWTKLNFEIALDIYPCTLIPVKGWLVWVFTSVEEEKKILHQHWKWGYQFLFLKKWCIKLNAC